MHDKIPFTMFIQKIVQVLKTLKFLLSHISYAPYIIWYNFSHLPFKQAIKLPIYILSRNKSLRKGKVIISYKKCFTGMIKLGYKSYHQYPIGITYYNDGGTIEFQGPCFISNNTSLLVYNGGRLVIGENVGISASLIMCSSSIYVGSGTMMGFGCTIMDSDFHPVIDIYARKAIKMSKPVIIGRNNWIGMGTLLSKGAQTPNNIIIGARSVIDKKYNFPEFSIVGMKQHAELLDEGYVSVFEYNIKKDINRKLTKEEIDKIIAEKHHT